MNNVLKGWISSILGVAIMLACVLVGLGFVEPKTDVSNIVLFSAFVAGFAMLFIPKSAEDAVKRLIKKKTS